MQKRRETILRCAHDLIAEEGFEAFTLKKLAVAACVTVPTIHNLIGSKDRVLEHLVADLVTRIEQLEFQEGDADPIQASETMISALSNLFTQDPNFYRAAFIAADRSQLIEHELPQGIFQRSMEIVTQVCLDAKEQGVLLGNISTQQLAYQIFAAHRLARNDWVNGYIEVSDYKKQALTGIFLILAADASPQMHKRLLKKLNTLKPID